MPKKLAVGVTNLDNKTAMVAPATKADGYLLDGKWRHRDDGWQHGRQVEAVNHFGRHQTAVGDQTTVLYLAKQPIGYIMVTGIEMVERDRMTDEHLAALDFPTMEAFLREADIFGPKLWFVRFERLSRLDATLQ